MQVVEEDFVEVVVGYRKRRRVIGGAGAQDEKEFVTVAGRNARYASLDRRFFSIVYPPLMISIAGWISFRSLKLKKYVEVSSCFESKTVEKRFTRS
jgi:hypothetical protein